VPEAQGNVILCERALAREAADICSRLSIPLITRSRFSRDRAMTQLDRWQIPGVNWPLPIIFLFNPDPL